MHDQLQVLGCVAVDHSRGSRQRSNDDAATVDAERCPSRCGANLGE